MIKDVLVNRQWISIKKDWDHKNENETWESVRMWFWEWMKIENEGKKYAENGVKYACA